MTDPFRRADMPLKQIFWGLIILIVNFNITLKSGPNTGVSCDIFHNVFGCGLVALGAGNLAKIVAPGRQQSRLVLYQFVALGSIPFAILGIFIFPRPLIIAALESAMGVVQVVTVLLFAHTFWAIARQWQLRVATLFQLATILIAVFHTLPLGTLYLVNLGLALTGQSYQYFQNLHPSVFGLLIVLVLAPMIVFLVAIHKMRNELKRPATRPHGFEVIFDDSFTA